MPWPPAGCPTAPTPSAARTSSSPVALPGSPKATRSPAGSPRCLMWCGGACSLRVSRCSTLSLRPRPRPARPSRWLGSAGCRPATWPTSWSSTTSCRSTPSCAAVSGSSKTYSDRINVVPVRSVHQERWSVLTIMAQEVAEQPAAIAATMEALRPLRAQIARLASGRQQILLVARGSSDNAAIYGRYLLEVHAGRTASLAAPSVATHYRSQLDLTGALVVAISQSGQTEEIVATQEWARQCGAVTIAVTNVEGSPLAQAADLAMVTAAGPERAALHVGDG